MSTTRSTASAPRRRRPAEGPRGDDPGRRRPDPRPPGALGSGGRPSRLRACQRRRRPEAGTAIVGTIVGFTIFMVLLLALVQTLVHLYAVSALTSAANDAADAVAEAGGSPSAVPAAQARAVAGLGTFGAERTRFDWLSVGPGEVRLRVVASSPALVPLPASYRRIVRTVTVRTERFR